MAKKAVFGLSCKCEGFLKNSRIWNWVLGAAFVMFFIAYTFYTAFGGETKNPSNLVGIAGIVFYVFISLLCSLAPHRVKWRPVVWGFALQVEKIKLDPFTFQFHSVYDASIQFCVIFVTRRNVSSEGRKK